VDRKIIWTKRASKKFDLIQHYLLEEWSDNTRIAFVDKTDIILNHLAFFPHLGPIEHQELGIYSFVISKQNTLFYRFNDSHLIVLNFFDTRQSNSKRSY
jgi:plasmid stabilization system protein ParE